LNAAAAIVVGGKAHDLHEGIAVAIDSIDSGGGYKKLIQLIEATSGSLEKLKALEATI